MKKKGTLWTPEELRRLAKERAAARRAMEPRASGEDPEAVVHELEVHQIELEMMNEELRAAREELEAGLDRYTVLFDFAPIGYATVTADGHPIVEEGRLTVP